MRARQLLDRPGPPLFSPETMKAVNQALDNAWATIAYKYVDDAKAAEARLKLAECVLAVTRDGSHDADQNERLALMMFQISNGDTTCKSDL
jgi:hypothetical protein